MDALRIRAQARLAYDLSWNVLTLVDIKGIDVLSIKV